MTMLLEAWTAAIWRASWEGGLIAAVVWIACRLMPSMPARFQAWLWRIVLLKFAVALIWSAPIGVPLLPAPQAAAIAENLPAPTPLGPTSDSSFVLPDSAPAVVFTPAMLVFIAWVIIVSVHVLLILRACRSAYQLKRNCRRSSDPLLLNQLASAAKSIGVRTSPPLLETNGNGSPMLVGLFRPAIVMPTTTLQRLDGAERGLILGHELAHFRRGDLIWGLFAAAVRAVFVFHPLVWLSERRLRLAQEMAADELAVARQHHDPIDYAKMLVSVVSKLGRDRNLPACSVAAAGSHQSLKQRISAMRFIKPLSRRVAAAYITALGAFVVLGVASWRVVAAEPAAPDAPAAQAPAAEKPAQKANPVAKSKTVWGKYVSFTDGTLTIQANSGAMIENKIREATKALVWNTEENAYKPAPTTDALKQAKPGTWMVVGESAGLIRIGARKGRTVGTFISFKNERLLLLGKDLGESYTKKYGNNLHMNKFRDDVPAYESIDGGEYKLVGTANKVLPQVKEGTTLTVYGEGDDNITRIDIGIPRKQ